MITKSMLHTALLAAGVAFVGTLVEQVASKLSKGNTVDVEQEEVLCEDDLK